MTVAPSRPLHRGDLDEAVDAVRGWDGLRGARLLVTGGTGFFGAWLLETLLRAEERFALGVRVLLLTRDPATYAARMPHVAGSPSVSLLRGDVRDFRAPEGAVSHIVHAATAASAALNDAHPLEMVDTIVAGTRRVLEVAAEKPGVRVLFTSSGAVYGRQPPELPRVPETFLGGPDPLDPRAAYAEGKRLAEHLCALFGARHGVATVVARGFAFAGAHLPLHAHFAFGNFLRDALAGGPVRVGGDGSPARSYLYGSDLAAWLWTMLLRGEAGRAYNLGSEAAVSVRELAERVGAAFGVGVEVARAADPARLPERYVPATTRARTELGLRETVGLDAAIARTARWHRDLG